MSNVVLGWYERLRKFIVYLLGETTRENIKEINMFLSILRSNTLQKVHREIVEM